MSASVALVFLVLTLPFCFYAAWSDLSRMRIPNKLNLWLFAVFLVSGILLLPIEDYGLRIAVALAALVIGFILNAAGVLGGGDAKFVAAMIPFVAIEHLYPFVMVFFGMMLAAFVTHRLFRAMPALRADTESWVSWGSGKKFPMGLALSGSLMFYLTCVAFFRFPFLGV